MASHKVPEFDGSDDESDGDNFDPPPDQELRLTKLGKDIPIPSLSDIPESEGPEGVLPEVAIINAMIVSDADGPRMPEATPPSSSGKLPRPSLDLTHKTPTVVSREDLYKIDASPEPVAHSSSTLLRKRLPKKSKKSSPPSRPQRQIRTASRKVMLDTDPLSNSVVESHSTLRRLHQTHEAQQRDPKRQRLETVVPEARPLRSGPATRSSRQPVTPGLDLSQPIGRQLRDKTRSFPMNQRQPFVPENDPSPELDAHYLKSPRRVHPASKKVEEVVVNTPTSNQISSESTNTSKQPTSPPAVVQNSPITKTSPVSQAYVVQDPRQECMGSDHPADPVSPVVDIKDVQTPVAEESQRSTREDSALWEPCTQPTRNTRSQAEILVADAGRIHELHETYLEDDSEDDFARPENCNDEKNSCEDIFVPEELKAALEKAHIIHGQAESVRQEFDGVRILKSYNALKKIVLQWKAAQNYSETGHLIQLSQKTRKEAKAIFQKSEWDQQRLRQEEVDRENEDELKLKEWRHRWTVLHDQRLGAEIEGRTFLSNEQSRHLRQVPLDNPYVVRPCWDNTDSFYLVEGLQKFKGPNVYREIFRKYCRHGGPLQQFNVAEIVDKAVSLKATLTKLAEDDGEELDQWVKDIFDPRVPPEGLCRDERRYRD
ncbi:hypothetical protein KCU98_g15276, partial [Aureobasidium melanogenum]